MLHKLRLRLGNAVRGFLLGPSSRHLAALHDLLLRLEYRQLVETLPNPFVRYGFKVFSQTDEDGLTLEIAKRLGVEKGVFVEFGVGDGSENNTLVLLACGWTGVWVGGEDLRVAPPQQSARLAFRKTWVTRDNIVATAESGLRQIGKDHVDVCSLDLDGNDLYFAEELLQSGFTPSLFIVEYNGKFPPPIRWAIDYDPAHRYEGADYFGASLATFNDLFARHGYFLVCCNAHSGANAFFVRREFRGQFSEVPEDIAPSYCSPRYYLPAAYGYPASDKTLRQLIRG